MATSAYPIYRAIGRPIVFKEFYGQYILYAAISLVADLLFFVVLYLCRIPPWVCIATAFGLGAAALGTTAWLSRQFGAHGLRKWLAARRLPRTIRCNSRQPFFDILKSKHYDQQS